MSVRRVSPRRVAVLAAVAGLLLAGPALAGCAGDSGLTSAAWHASTVRTSAAPSPTPASPSPTPFVGTASPVTADTVAHTWHAGCPVGPSQLRLLHLSYWGFDNSPHVGTMVVNSVVVTDVLKVFQSLYEQRFPIRQMQPEDAYGGSDPDSMAADNTSGFNCRNAVATGKPSWSVHAYGEAIDVNTVENPYIFQGQSQPPAGAAYEDRSNVRPGMAVKGGVLVQAFAAVGWQWGGRWADGPDYQHFSKTGG
ncbi:M15 family metallopeptidase [Rugosimonospora acidiphila]|uniref:M15 family metallopeptidase n=1 Tax=Rugosimonospora acidiphila TaxID=556531 RepID=A0ABP9SRR1_9ACTN